MATEAARVIIPVEENAKQAEANFKRLDRQLDRTSRSTNQTSKAFQALKSIGIAALALRAAKAVGEFAGEVVRLASVAEETNNKFQVTFRGINDAAQSAADNLATNFGLARTEARSLLADTGDLLTGFGFTRESALDLSTQVQELAVDLASFTNFSGGAAGASQALTKALLGERESIKSLGIAITEADIAQLAEEKGIVGEIDRQTKAQLTLELALRQSGNAIGDFERSQASFANQVRIAEARVRDQKEAIGNVLLPFANLAVTAFNNLGSGLAGTVEQINSFIRSAEGAEAIGRIFGQIAGAVAVVVEQYKIIGAQLRESLQPAFDQVREVLESFKNEGENSGVVFRILGNVLQGIVAGVGVFGAALNATITNIRNFVQAVSASAQAVGSAFQVFNREVTFRDIRDNFRQAGDAFRDFGQGVVQGYGQIFQEIKEQVGDFTAGAEDNAEALLEAFAETSERIGERVSTTLQASTQGAINAVDEAAAASEDAAAQAAQAAADEARERERIAAETAETLAAIEAEYTRKILEQSGDRIAVLEAERDDQLAAVEAGTQAAILIEQFYANEINSIRDELAAEEAERQQDILDERRKAAEEALQIEFDRARESARAERERLEEIREIRQDAREAELEAEERAAQERVAIEEAGRALQEALVDAYVTVVNSLIDATVENERQAAQAKKAIAIFKAGIDTASAIIGFLADPGGVPGVLLSIAAGITGAAQIAAIASKPLPAAAFGGQFTVPPGLGGDAGLMRVSSGEEVSVRSARESGDGGMPRAINVTIGGRDFAAAVEDSFNRGGAQIRRSGAVR
jgi:hypothetical protein